MSLTNIAQTYDKTEYQFVTLGNNGFGSNFQGTANSIRLKVTDTISVRRAAFDFLVKDFFKSGLKVKIRTLLAILIATIRRTRLISRASVRLMTDQPADESSNYFEITGIKNGNWTGRIKLELDPKVSGDSDVLIQTFNRSLEQSRYIKKGNRLSLRENFQVPENIWRDTGHYYGSVPVGLLNSYQTTGDENLQLNGFTNIFVIGASCFPIGSHGHPTKLIMDLATRLGKHISEKNE
jgi:choline dehydrogenase-like flavoprotein